MASGTIIATEVENSSDIEENTLSTSPHNMESSENGMKDDICPFYFEGKCRFGNKCQYVHPWEEEIKSDPKSKKKNKKVKQKVKDDVYAAKKPPLKTAGDVRHRILWDPALPQEHFSLGYMDRFAGLVEKPFSSFVWCDHLCNAGPEDLAIPQHCMTYFKYKGIKVWDKTIRLDHVFGSAGNKTKIEQKMTEIDAQVQKEYEERLANGDESDDDEFELDVVLSNRNDITELAKDIKRKQLDDSLLRATHFICIRVNEAMVKEEILKVQESVYYQDPSLRSCAMPQDILHVTLAMVKCDTPESIEEVGKLVDSLQSSLQELVSAHEGPSQRSIIATGLSTFGARVLYAKLQTPDSFNRAVDVIQEKIRTIDGAHITNNFEFIPHMTLIKVNRQTERERRSKYMCSSLYDDYLDHTFGVINFDNIYFCSIDEGRGRDGFYRTVKSVKF